MTLRKTAFATALGAALLLPAAAGAHFQLSYTPTVQIDRPGDVPVKLIFWHPFENGHVMDMEATSTTNPGFAALGSGPDTDHEGKALSQDAVIWIRAYDLQ
ncbi:hypothetical protein [Roseospira navarrensis]|uniref:Cobalt/nickel transport protein n=1 Tax=Roseospira navarrensis TaxID=140058 RepID=A0A7X2D2J6_9PROT|nr:hypothetical protein [Roseospira navarrensis]MQX35843.1 hypothetical protein [Roseospira navarrensis]